MLKKLVFGCGILVLCGSVACAYENVDLTIHENTIEKLVKDKNISAEEGAKIMFEEYLKEQKMKRLFNEMLENQNSSRSWFK